MKTVVFSDVHLNVARDGRENMAGFVEFLRTVDPAEVGRIIILGDLFDFWFEYRHVIFSDYFEVLRAFADLKDAGVEFHFICGNHDFWAGRFLEEYLGFSIYTEPVTLELHGLRAHLAHGDGENPQDVGYRLYKKVARCPFVVWAFRLIHPDWAMAIAQGVSRGSRRMFGADDPSKGSEVLPLREYAQGVLASGRADVVMCGHSHHPVREEHPTPTGRGLYINVGDWLWHQSYVEWDESGFVLRRFGESATEPESARETEQPIQQ